MWRPSRVLVAAELVVEFDAHTRQIEHERVLVERMGAPLVARLAHSTAQLGSPSQVQAHRLVERFAQALAGASRFGYRSARAEVARLRAESSVLAAVVPDAGAHGRLARGGLPALDLLLLERARVVVEQITQALRALHAERIASASAAASELEAELAFAARNTLHKGVLELVGEALNLGRTAGALSLAQPPQFAMRSEALDRATCEPCEALHGEIAELDSSDYYAILPPEQCAGEGRCRGIMVYGDEPAQLSVPEAA